MNWSDSSWSFFSSVSSKPEMRLYSAIFSAGTATSLVATGSLVVGDGIGVQKSGHFVGGDLAFGQLGFGIKDLLADLGNLVAGGLLAVVERNDARVSFGAAQLLFSLHQAGAKLVGLLGEEIVEAPRRGEFRRAA